MTEGPYELPAGWRWVRLGEVFVLRNGKFIRKRELDDTGGVRVYGSNGIIGYTGGVEPFIQIDTIVIGRVGACGAVNIAVAPAWISDNAMYICEWKFDCDLNFFALALRFSNLGTFSKQGAQPSISQAEVYQMSIPLPPLEEQRRIVARVEELMGRVGEARCRRQEAGADAERLWQAALAEVFPRPGTDLPAGWRWVRLGEVACVKYGKARPKEQGNVPVIGSGGIYGTTKEPLVHFSTVVIGRKGSAGEPIFVSNPSWPSDTTFYLDWLIDLVPRWVFLWLTLYTPSPSSTTATLPSLRRQDLETLLIPLPPLEEQRRIVAHLQAMQERIRALQAAQAETEARLLDLERSILDKAFRGEL